MDAKNTMVIGIAGGIGSGKRTTVTRLKERFGEDLNILFYNNYYKDNADLPFDKREAINYEHPDSFDLEHYIADIEALLRGEDIESPIYDIKLFQPSEQGMPLHPTRVLVLEGIMVLHEPRLRELMDIKVFIDTDADVRLLRRMTREVQERGRPLSLVGEYYMNVAKPMHYDFVEPSKRYADIVIPQGGFNTVALDMLFERIASHLRS